MYCETHKMEYVGQCPKCKEAGGVLDLIDPGNPEVDPAGYTGIPNQVVFRITARADIVYSGKKGDGFGILRRSGFQDGAIDTYQEMKGDKKKGAISFETWQRREGVTFMEIKKNEWVYTIQKKAEEGKRPFMPEYHNFTLEELYQFFEESTGQL